MRNLIYQYYYDWKHKDSVKTEEPYYVLSKNSISAYCQKYGIHYKFLDDKLDVPFYGIFIPFQEGWIEEFDNVCFVDSDFLATIDAENIFEYVADTEITINFMNTASGEKHKTLLPNLNQRGHANSGVVNVPRALFAQFSEYVVNELGPYDATRQADIRLKDLGDYDQAFINLFLGRTGLYHKLPDKFNYHMGRQPHDKRWSQSLIHYHRKNKAIMLEDYKGKRILR